MNPTPSWLQSARDHWQWRGQTRPPFALKPQLGQTSVWDFPRPPQLAADQREVVIRWGEIEVARTRRAIKVLETSHPPSFYLPWADVAHHLLQRQPGSSFCKWKGPAQYWSLAHGNDRLDGVAWSYPCPWRALKRWQSASLFTRQTCIALSMVPWCGHNPAGPFKGGAGSSGW